MDDLHADLILTRGEIALAQGKPKDAERWYAETLAWAKKRKLRAYEARALAKLASLTVDRRDEVTARSQLEEAIDLFRATHTLRSVEGCEAMLTYAQLLGAQGRTVRMVRILEEVAQVARRQDLPLVLARTQLAIARARLTAGQASQAKEPLQAARSGLEAAGETPQVAEGLRELGQVLVEAGKPVEAHAVLEAALAGQERSGNTRHRAATLNDLARVLIQQGNLAEAQARAKEALDLAEAHHQSAKRAQILVTIPTIAKQQHRWRQAIDLLTNAVELFKKGKRVADVAETARELGMLLKERGKHAAAAEHLAMVIANEQPQRR